MIAPGPPWPPIRDGLLHLSTTQLAMLLDGLEWTRVTPKPVKHSEALNVIPAILRVLWTIRPKYACRSCTDGVVQPKVQSIH